jgi:hypothetical protein
MSSIETMKSRAREEMRLEILEALELRVAPCACDSDGEETCTCPKLSLLEIKDIIGEIK